MIGLDKIYMISQHVEGLFLDGKLTQADLDSVVIHVSVQPDIFYGIDQEFYRQTNGGSAKDYKPSDSDIYATVDGVNFVISQKS